MSGLPVLQSPFSAVVYGDAKSAGLEDVTGQFALIHVQGEGTLAVLAQSFGDGPHKPGDIIASSSGLFVALRSDIGLVLASPAAAEDVRSRIATAAGERLTVVDITHGQGLMALSGPSAAAVLSSLCGLDFGERAFPHLHAAQTSLARVRALIIRVDQSATRRYLLGADRSHSLYVWETLAEAMQEFLAGA